MQAKITLPDTARDPWIGQTEFPKVLYYDDSKSAFDGNTWSGSIALVGHYPQNWKDDLVVEVTIGTKTQTIRYPYSEHSRKQQFKEACDNYVNNYNH